MRGKHRFPLFLVTTLCALPLSAANYKVQHLNDSSTLGDGCSLREAIAAHNSSNLKGANECGAFDPGADSIEFPGLTGTLRLNSTLGELVLTEPALTLQGPGANLLAISGGKVMSVLVLDRDRPAALTVRGLTIRDGLGSPVAGGPSGQGGGIRMELGGAVLAQPTTIVIEDSALLANSVPFAGASRGAAITSYGSLVLRRSLVRFNQSDFGAIFHTGDALIEDSEFSDNLGQYLGSAVVLYPPGPWIVRRTLFRDNVDIQDGPSGLLLVGTAGSGIVENCTFTGNSSSTGSVVMTQAPITVRNSTFYANKVTGYPGGGGVLHVDLSTVRLASNLFGKHELRDISVNPNHGAAVDATYNLFHSDAASLPPGVVCATSTLGGANLCGVAAAGVGSLGPNGGSTWTIPLLAASPAINAGSSPGSLTTDQRGPGFARSVGLGTDIGAFEVQP
ncbi:MAG: right-handed parallel beta-helix repeat-containing protein [Acidobacteriota bacterium]